MNLSKRSEDKELFSGERSSKENTSINISIKLSKNIIIIINKKNNIKK